MLSILGCTGVFSGILASIDIEKENQFKGVIKHANWNNLFGLIKYVDFNLYVYIYITSTRYTCINWIQNIS